MAAELIPLTAESLPLAATFLPLDLLGVMIKLAPWQALNALIRTCHYAASVPIDPAKYVSVHSMRDGDEAVLTLPNGRFHGEMMCKTDDHSIVLMYNRGDLVSWSHSAGYVVSNSKAGSRLVMHNLCGEHSAHLLLSPDRYIIADTDGGVIHVMLSSSLSVPRHELGAVNIDATRPIEPQLAESLASFEAVATAEYVHLQAVPCNCHMCKPFDALHAITVIHSSGHDLMPRLYAFRSLASQAARNGVVLTYDCTVVPRCGIRMLGSAAKLGEWVYVGGDLIVVGEGHSHRVMVLTPNERRAETQFGSTPLRRCIPPVYYGLAPYALDAIDRCDEWNLIPVHMYRHISWGDAENDQISRGVTACGSHQSAWERVVAPR